jgi:hypothetical protein
MHHSLKIIKTLLYSYSALHVSGTLASIIRSLLILHIQPSVTVCRWVLTNLSVPLRTWKAGFSNINIEIKHQTIRGFHLSIHNNSDEAV